MEWTIYNNSGHKAQWSFLIDELINVSGGGGWHALAPRDDTEALNAGHPQTLP